MEITRDDIITAIAKLRQAGKKMPQADRIREAADRGLEEKKVMAETVQLWHQLFIPKHVRQDDWNAALNKALLKNEINTTIITPGLMESCLRDVEQENELKREAESRRAVYTGDNPFYDENERQDMLAAMKWGLLTIGERKEIAMRGGNPIGDFIQEDKVIVKKAMDLLGVSEEDAWAQKVLLRCWNNDRLYSQRTGEPAKTSIGFRNDGRMVLCYE